MNNNLQDILHSKIPLTQAIGIEVISSSHVSLSLAAPLDKNLNHQCTAFGGSLYSVAVLTGWGLIYLLMERQGLTGHIVIQESHTQYIKPVTEKILSHCSFQSEKDMDKFLAMYKRKGIARIKLKSYIKHKGETCVVFTGSYVVHQ